MYYQTLTEHRYAPLNKVKIYNFTPDDFKLKEISFPQPTAKVPLDDIWKTQPPAIIHSKEIASFELIGIHDVTATKSNQDWYIALYYHIGNTGQSLRISYDRNENQKDEYHGRTASAMLHLDDLMCDNGFYFMMFQDESDSNLNSTRLIIKKIIREKSLVFKSKHHPSLLNDSKVIVNSHGQVEFTTDILLNNKKNKTLTYLNKVVEYNHNFADDDTPHEDNLTYTTLWQQEDRGLHCPDADPFDFTFPHKYTAPGLTFRITAIFIVDAQSNKTETHTFEVISEKKHP